LALAIVYVARTVIVIFAFSILFPYLIAPRTISSNLWWQAVGRVSGANNHYYKK
jgi:hypothetical protein